jgi:hypothetical protein
MGLHGAGLRMDAAAAKQRQEPLGLRQPLLQRHYHDESQSYVCCGNEARLANGTSDFMPTPVAVTGLNNAAALRLGDAPTTYGVWDELAGSRPPPAKRYCSMGRRLSSKLKLKREISSMISFRSLLD